MGNIEITTKFSRLKSDDYLEYVENVKWLTDLKC